MKIGIIELRSGMLRSVHRSALTESIRILHDAPIEVAAVDAVSLEEFIETFNQTTISEPILMDGFPMYDSSDELVLRRLRDTAIEQECPVILSAQVSAEQQEEWHFDRWFDVILRVRRSEINRECHDDHQESIEVETIKNRHGPAGTVYLEYEPRNGLVGDIDAGRVSTADLHTSLEKINGRHGVSVSPLQQPSLCRWQQTCRTRRRPRFSRPPRDRSLRPCRCSVRTGYGNREVRDQQRGDNDAAGGVVHVSVVMDH